MTFNPITNKDVAIICATKNQPNNIMRMLDSIAESQIGIGQILISDGGKNLKKIIEPYKNKLKVRCIYSPISGQVLQRNYAHKFLHKKIRLVIYFDDDITIEKDALSKMVLFWNNVENHRGKSLAGASFNLINAPIMHNSIFRKLFLIDIEPKGCVKKGGYAVPFCPANKTHEVSWLLGGATAWSREVLDNYPHPIDFPTKWAVCEDLIYSFPLSQTHKMFVVQDAKVRHDEKQEIMKFSKGLFYGKSSVVMRYYFCSINKDIDSMLFFWMTFGILFGHFGKSLRGSLLNFAFFLGGVSGLISIFLNFFSNKNAKDLATQLCISDSMSIKKNIRI